jgi:hypothetical protein
LKIKLQVTVPVYLFAGTDEGSALSCMLRLWHRTAGRHPIFLVGNAAMPTLRTWVEEHAPRVQWLEKLTSETLPDCPAVFIDAASRVPPGWLGALTRAAEKSDEVVRAGEGLVFLKRPALAGGKGSYFGVRDVIADLGGFFKKLRMVDIVLPGVGTAFEHAAPPSDHRILTVIHDATGGAVRTSEDLCRALAQAGPWQPWLLRCGLFAWRLEWFAPDGEPQSAGTVEFCDCWTMDREDPDRLDAFARLLRELTPGVVHVRHLLGSGPWLLRHARAAGTPVLFSHHDYYAVCPNVELIDASGACLFWKLSASFSGAG